ncbi:carbon-nitrogen hydrolase family protein [Pseudomonas sp. 25 R 14]|uniref:carbon-nitrogen hydrolase family protein n=1 Tax=Pseudomonas sp. 25 R 14 TaxID=1844109 RepID=UPI000811FF0D|nr:carbon-nitrogen hydrolase family protein [Pseudomonas sp. 25 R 14]CRM75561.1 (R)-stereoselective amidase [Pseudomonas sp. 25 R 14]
MKVELVQLAGRDGDTTYNLDRTLKAIAACASDTELVVFPELQLMGFPSASIIKTVAEPLDGPSVQAVQRMARERNLSVVLGVLEKDVETYYNTSVLITPEGIALRYRKTHPWILERGLTTPGNQFTTVLWNGIQVGLLICFDIEFPESARALAQLGAELVIVINGNMDPYGPIHRTAIMARAQENQVFTVMVNRVGHGDGGLCFAGGSAVLNPFGQFLYEAGREECRQVVELDFEQLKVARQDYCYLDERRLILPGDMTEHFDGRRELTIP